MTTGKANFQLGFVIGNGNFFVFFLQMFGRVAIWPNSSPCCLQLHSVGPHVKSFPFAAPKTEKKRENKTQGTILTIKVLFSAHLLLQSLLAMKEREIPMTNCFHSLMFPISRCNYFQCCCIIPQEIPVSSKVSGIQLE